MENPGESAHIVCFGDFELDLRTAELRSNGDHAILQEKPFQILVALLEQPGAMVTREELIRRLWPSGVFVDFNLGLNKAVNRLREGLEDAAEQARFIQPFPKRGYRFVAPVTRNGTEPALASVPSTAHASSERSSRGQGNGGRGVMNPPADALSFPSAEVGPGKTYWRWAAVAVVAILIVRALGGGYALRSRTLRNRGPNLEKFQVTKLTDSGKVELAAISGDGSYVCYSLRDRGIAGLWLHQVATHSDVQVLPADAIGFEGLTFSPEGNHIYYVRADKNDPGFKYLYVMPVLGGL